MRFFYICMLPFLLLAGLCRAQQAIYKSDAFTVYPDRVVQGKYSAKALSATRIVSNYESVINQQKSPLINFKFSINGKDNELPAGVNHSFYCVPGKSNETPLIKFGVPLTSKVIIPAGQHLQRGTQLTIQLDMRDVFAAFDKDGFYTGADGEKMYAKDFKGIYIAGNTAPMIWDVNNLVHDASLQLKDADGDHIYNVTLLLNEAKAGDTIPAAWQLTRNVSAFPQYQSGYTISDAVYNMALQEMENAIEPDSTFRTGKEWEGVWTRDISYSIILSMAILQPKVAMYSLMRKVKNGIIIQDTGTGGAYPISTDRMVWVIAAWEVYKVTGDKAWLQQAFEIAKRSAAADVLNIYDNETGLVRGESSFLDWREQTYPVWMQPADIFESDCLGTNAVHFRVNQILSIMAGLANDTAASANYIQTAERIRTGIQKRLWVTAKEYYGQYLYGRDFKLLSPKAEALGAALTVLFEVDDKQRQRAVISNTPVTAFGIPCIYPQIPGILPYHNNGIWPFVESFWAMAAAQAGNEQSVVKSIAAIYRPAMFFLTNKENFVAANGDFAGTQINSSNMLWSLSGNIALVYKVLFGIHYNEDNLEFNPFVPKALEGNRRLTNYRYRNAVLNISLIGYGNQISSILLDGLPLAEPKIPADLQGVHSIAICLTNTLAADGINLVPLYTSPLSPMVSINGRSLSWLKVPGATAYKVIYNGRIIKTTPLLQHILSPGKNGEYQVIAIDKIGCESFASAPLKSADALLIIEAEKNNQMTSLTADGYQGTGYVEINSIKNTDLHFTANIDTIGFYAISFRYANGNGPVNTENKCAIRTLNVAGKFAGTVVLPQRGRGEWSNWGYSNSVKAKLQKGIQKISLQLTAANTNMNGEVNQAMIDQLILKRIE